MLESIKRSTDDKYIRMMKGLNKLEKRRNEGLFKQKSIPFTPLPLLEDMIIKVNPALDAKILILFTVEAVPVLKDYYGFSNITVATDTYCPFTAKACGIFGVKYTLIEESQKMKFDAVIMNSPYDRFGSAKNNKLWKDFAVKAMDFSDVIAAITPEGALSNSVNGEDLHKKMNANGFYIGYGQLHDSAGRKVFKEGVSTCHWIATKQKTDFNPVMINTKKEIDDTLASIVSKVTSYSKKLPLVMQNGHVTKADIVESGKNEILFSGDKVKRVNVDICKPELKVVFPFSCSYHKAFITSIPTGQLNLVMPIKNEEEGAIILEYAMSPLFKLVANTYKKTSGFTPFIKNAMIPDLRDEDISDLYALFNLTQEEIDYVESNSK